MKKLFLLIITTISIAASAQNLDSITITQSFRGVDWLWQMGNFEAGKDSARISFEKKVLKAVRDTAVAMSQRGITVVTANNDLTNAFYTKVIPVNNIPISYLIWAYRKYIYAPDGVFDVIGEDGKTRLRQISEGNFLYYRGIADANISSLAAEDLKAGQQKGVQQ